MQDNSLGTFSHARRARVGSALLSSMQHNRTLCLNRLGRDQRQTRQFTEFLANRAVSAQDMVIHAGRQTGQRVVGRHILAVQDTTELHFATHVASKRGFGAGGNGLDPGLFLHPSLAVDADGGGIIGLVDCTVMNRTKGKVTARHTRSAQEKESGRRLEAAITAGDVLSEAAMITMVGDRESDIHDLFAGICSPVGRPMSTCCAGPGMAEC